jgi:hypothetical protein
MVDIATLILVVMVVTASASAVCSALILVGGLLAVVRADHRNPVVNAFFGWYHRHVAANRSRSINPRASRRHGWRWWPR